MDLLTLATMAVTYIVTEIKNSKGLKQANDEFSSAVWQWIKPLFLKDEQPLIDLKAQPDNELNQLELKTKILKEITNNPDSFEELKKIFDKHELKGNIVTQHHSGSGDNVGNNKVIYTK